MDATLLVTHIILWSISAVTVAELARMEPQPFALNYVLAVLVLVVTVIYRPRVEVHEHYYPAGTEPAEEEYP